MMHDVAVDGAAAGGDDVVRGAELAVVSARLPRGGDRWMPQRSVVEPLNPQLVCGDAVPEERRVARGGGSDESGGIEVGRRIRGPGLRSGRELQYPKVHLRDDLVIDAPRVARGEEPALSQRGVLRADEVDELGADRHLLAGRDVPVVDGVAVGRDHRCVTGRVEEFGHQTQRIVVRADTVQATHGPDLSHRGRGDDPVVTGGTSGVGVDVDRVRVAHRLDPVVDHRPVDRVAARPRRTGARGLDLIGRGADLRWLHAHLFTRGRPSPAVPIMSRITSLTPPPKVMTAFRLAVMSSQSARSAVVGSE